MANSRFQFKQFIINQDKTAMKVGVDGVLLGAVSHFGSAKRILDIGAGTGLLSFMAAQRTDAKIIALVHAGWRGIVTKIIPNTLATMERIGADLKKIKIEVGPGISQENFDFGFKEMLKEFGKYNQDRYIVKGSTIDKIKIDLEQIIHDQIIECDVDSNNIKTSGLCTFNNNDFFSARRYGGDSFSAMITIVGMH